MSLEAETYRFTSEQYRRIGEAGVFAEDDRLELLNGEIVTMAPRSRWHVGVVRLLLNFFLTKAGTRWVVDCQNPITLDEYSEPRPDLVLITEDGHERSGFPEPEDIFLLVEVAESSLVYDRKTKLAAYARAKIAEVWIINLVQDRVECCRAPDGHRYERETIWRRGALISPEAFPDTTIAVDDMLPR
jgi:Uma2 family endonuclease